MDIVYGRDDAILDTLLPQLQANPAGVFGGMYLGVISDFLFLGILSNQVWRYHTCFPKDSPWTKSLVALCVTLATLTSIQTFLVVWKVNIVHFADWRYAVTPLWFASIEPTTTAISTLVAQIFFVWRTFVLTGHNWYILGPMLAMMATILGLSICATLQVFLDPYNLPGRRQFGVPLAIVGLVLNLLITGVMFFRLLRNMRDGFGTVFQRWLSLILQTAVPALIPALVTPILLGVSGGRTTWYLFFGMLVPRLYLFCLMYTLNSGVGARQTSTFGTSGTEFSPGVSDDTATVGGSGRRKPAGPTGTLSTFRAVPHHTTFDATGTCALHGRTQTIPEEEDQSAAPHQVQPDDESETKDDIHKVNLEVNSVRKTSEDRQTDLSLPWETEKPSPEGEIHHKKRVDQV